ncbi:serine/threonine-protein kinase [Piscinibacter terrae]|nr:serine/threonine-protein kinase [Albitalea terrae]
MGATPVEPAGLEANRADALAEGSRLDIYEIERVLGASGFGFVYLAYDPSTRQRVAIKEYLPDTLAVRDEDGMQVLVRADSHIEAFERGRSAFIEESNLLAKCEHPSLVRVLRSWQAKGTAYRVMPYYPGNSLFSLREAMEAPPDEASLRALLDGLMGALETLHKAGAVHREVSPWNILLLPDDTPILLDFNAARRAMVGDRARALMSLLSPTFAPPELMDPSSEKPVGPWTDVHALAQVVVYCLTGQMPRSSTSSSSQREPMAVLVRRMQARFPTLHFSDSFMRAIDAALSPDPAHRPKVMAELRKRLDDHPVPMVVGIREDEPVVSASSDEAPSVEAVQTPSADADSLTKDVPVKKYTQPHGPAAPDESASASEGSAQDAPGADDRPLMDLFREAVARADATSSRAEPARPKDAGSVAGESRSEEPFYSVLSASEGRDAASPPVVPSSKPVVTSRSPSSFAMYPEERVPTFDFAARNRRVRRRWTAATVVLAVSAMAGAAWWVLQERSATELRSAFEQAVSREVGVKAPVADASPAPIAEHAAAASAVPAATNPPAPTASVPSVVSVPANEPPNASTRPGPANVTAVAPEPTAALSSGTSAQAATAATAPVDADQHNEAPAPKKPVKQTHASVKPTITSPREACGARTDFSLYRCMQNQCAQAQWKQHPACKRLKATDEIS